MAEAIFRRLAETRGLPVEVKSAGVAAMNGQPMAGHARETLRNRGIAAEGFQSREVTEDTVAWADLILTMTSHHKRHLLELYPSAVEKTFALKEFASAGNPVSAAFHQEREALVAELQLRLALNQPIREEERKRLYELEQQLPDVDIPDPIGGSRQLYEYTAAEIEQAATVVLDRWMG
jgi:protein-tyrosine-phosphatase